MPDKDSLEKLKQDSRQKLNQHFQNLNSDLGKLATGAAIVAGAIAGLFIVSKVLGIGEKGKKSKATATDSTKGALVPVSRPEHPIVAMVKGAIISFLLSIAKEKLMELIQHYQNKKTTSKDKNETNATAEQDSSAAS